MVKRYGSLQPSSESDFEVINNLPDGCMIKVEISRPRNAQFHRKYFALLDVLYEMFTPPEDADKGAVKNRKRFREDIACVTGYFDYVVNLKGEVRAQARSISFAKMEQADFEDLYEKTITYGLQKIAAGKSRGFVDDWVAQILDFA